MRTLSAALLAAQQATKRIPAIRILINSVDYSSRLLRLEHREEPYRDYARIVLNNADRGLDSVASLSTNLLGYRFRIAYGYDTGEVVAEPNGDGVSKEYSETADLWVKTQQMITEPGGLVCVLECEGQWGYLREQHVMALIDQVQLGDPSEVTDDPYFVAAFDKTKTVYELIESVIQNAFGWTLNATPSPDDGILNGPFKPYFSLEKWPYAATVLTDLIEMTKCYLRAKANLTWDILYPQEDDSVDETYYSNQSPYFLRYAESLSLVVPNRVVVFAGNPLNEIPWPEPVIVGDTGAYSGSYVEVLEPKFAPSIESQPYAEDLANAILTRYNSERLSGYLLIHHDARVELYDKPRIEDLRDVG